jgi:hypothetical protein
MSFRQSKIQSSFCFYLERTEMEQIKTLYIITLSTLKKMHNNMNILGQRSRRQGKNLIACMKVDHAIIDTSKKDEMNQDLNFTRGASVDETALS